jgi:hypothetical protein
LAAGPTLSYAPGEPYRRLRLAKLSPRLIGVLAICTVLLYACAGEFIVFWDLWLGLAMGTCAWFVVARRLDHRKLVGMHAGLTHQKLAPGIRGGAMFLVLLGLGIFRAYVYSTQVDGHLVSRMMSQCSSNLRAVGDALLVYANGHAGRYPANLQDLCAGPSGLTADLLICPATMEEPSWSRVPLPKATELVAHGHLSYVYLGKGLGLDAPPDAVLAYEPLSNHQRYWRTASVLYASGHVEQLHEQEARKLISELESGHNPPRPEKLK